MTTADCWLNDDEWKVPVCGGLGGSLRWGVVYVVDRWGWQERVRGLGWWLVATAVTVAAVNRLEFC